MSCLVFQDFLTFDGGLKGFLSVFSKVIMKDKSTFSLFLYRMTEMISSVVFIRVCIIRLPITLVEFERNYS